MPKIGMFSYFSYPLSIEERLHFIKQAGFDATSLWWSGDGRHKQPELARSVGLEIDNVHAPFQNANVLWLPGQDGEDYLSILEGCVRDCKTHDIPTVVIHAAGFRDEPVISKIGTSRLQRLVSLAEDCGINLAFENLHTLEHLDHIFQHFASPYVGFCYDNGHELCNTPDGACLERYGSRLFAIHLDDNLGDGDTHLLPYDGIADWDYNIMRLKNSKPLDILNFELRITSFPERPETHLYDNMDFADYLKEAYKRACKIAYKYSE